MSDPSPAFSDESGRKWFPRAPMSTSVLVRFFMASISRSFEAGGRLEGRRGEVSVVLSTFAIQGRMPKPKDQLVKNVTMEFVSWLDRHFFCVDEVC